MSQQLNLLPQAKSRYSPALVALSILGLALLIVLSAWGVKRSMLTTARIEEAASAAQAKEASAQLEERFRARSQQLNAEIEALKTRAAAAEQVLALSAGVGKPEGYSPYFALLGTIREEGVWLTGVTVNQAGKSMQLTGLALDKDALLRYTQRLNAAFASTGIQLSALEMTAQTANAAASSGGTGASVAGIGNRGNSLKVIQFTLR
jgi:Tfp pilus assembly protein PilN